MPTEREHRLKPYLGHSSRDVADGVPGRQPGVGKTTLVEQEYGRPQHPSAFGMQAQSYARYLRSMEPSFGADFSSVQIHPDSPRAGSADAFTEGNEIHFASGKWAPESTSGRWLLAHELAHVVQQRGGNAQHAPGLAHEADADHAANAAVSGGRATVTVGARHGARQNYEAWEHRAIGDSGGGNKRIITTNTGVALTYGQVVALSGDFYRSPEQLMNAPKAELENVLAVMKREEGLTHANARTPYGRKNLSRDESAEINNAYDFATTGPDSREANGQDLDGEHVADNGPFGALITAVAKFTDLARNNASHFSPENIELNYKPQHQRAIDLAKEVFNERAVSGGKPRTNAKSTPANPAHAKADRKEADAYMTEGFAAHFLTDAFASGHLISGGYGRKLGAEFYRANKDGITSALAKCLKNTGTLGPPAGPQAASAITSMLSFLADGLTLKIIHDYLNENGLWVKNEYTTWHTVGDGNLHSSRVTQQQASLAAQASRAAIDKVLHQGFVTDEERDRPLTFIPKWAKFGDDDYKLIADFATDPTIFQTILSKTMLNHDQDENRLWQLVSHYVGPLLKSSWQTLRRDPMGPVRSLMNGAKAMGKALVNAPGDALDETERVLDEGKRVLTPGPPR